MSRKGKKVTSNINGLNYYRAYLKRLEKEFKASPPEGEIEREMKAARIMQGLVRRQFYFSLLEANRRSNPFRSRYDWKVNGGSITLYFPMTIHGADRRKWLEEHVDIKKIDPFSGCEPERIQWVINQYFINNRLVPIDDIQNLLDEKTIPTHWPEEDSVRSLAQVVSEEKAANLKSQRPAVKVLGREKLKQLILRIFDDIPDPDYSDGKLAQAFGLSRATFSRFAGSQWHKKDGASIPDLWRNTAKILSENPDFEEMAISFQEQIDGALERDKHHKDKGQHNE